MLSAKILNMLINAGEAYKLDHTKLTDYRLCLAAAESLCTDIEEEKFLNFLIGSEGEIESLSFLAAEPEIEIHRYILTVIADVLDYCELYPEYRTLRTHWLGRITAGEYTGCFIKVLETGGTEPDQDYLIKVCDTADFDKKAGTNTSVFIQDWVENWNDLALHFKQHHWTVKWLHYVK